MWARDSPLLAFPFSWTRKEMLMNWNFLISFGIGLGVYFIILGVITFIKRHKNKKLAQADEEKFKNDNQEKQEDNVNKD